MIDSVKLAVPAFLFLASISQVMAEELPSPPEPPASATGAGCFGKFKLAAKTDKMVTEVMPGLVPPPQLDENWDPIPGTTAYPLPHDSFSLTRMVWTIEPNPNPNDKQTLIYTYPENLVRFSLIDMCRSYYQERPDIWPNFNIKTARPQDVCRTTFFEPLLLNYTGEAGVLIQVPAEALEEIKMHYFYSLNSQRFQINDGFPNLRRVRVDTTIGDADGLEFKKVNGQKKFFNEVDVDIRDIFPGEGVQLRMHTLPMTSSRREWEPLDLHFLGDGFSIQAQVDSATRLIELDAKNSEMMVRSDGHIDMYLGGSDRFKCTPQTKTVRQRVNGAWLMVPIENCGTRTFLEGPFNPSNVSLSAHLPPYTTNTSLQVNDPSGLFDCASVQTDSRIKSFATCTTTNSPAPPYEPFQCTTKPVSDQDTLFCNVTSHKTILDKFTKTGAGSKQERLKYGYEPFGSFKNGFPQPQYHCRVPTSILPPYLETSSAATVFYWVAHFFLLLCTLGSLF